MEYTKEMRLAAYNHAKALIDEGELICICPGIFDFFNKEWGGMNCWEVYDEIINNFPEFMQYKPAHKNIGQIWWPGTEAGRGRRLEVLNEIIAEMEKE